MAVKERITILGDVSVGFNVDQAVGPSAPNLFDDVQLVQAYINFIILGRNGNTIGGRLTGMKSRYEVPRVTGKIDDLTLAAIKTFQSKWAHNLIRTDGTVHPAHYAGRDIKTGGRGPLMTITLLHQLAQSVAAENFNSDDYTVLMRQMFSIMPRDWSR
jgi:hypothetical protein